jgi:hypothetical protein
MRGIDLRLTHQLKDYDRSLYVYENDEGLKMVMRKADRLEASDYLQSEDDSSLIHPQMIFPLTDTGDFKGKPVEWGIERIMFKLKAMDLWRNDSWLSERKKRLERIKENEEKERRNHFRDVAAEMRPMFAKATNHINTSTLAKVDHRRKKDGHLKSRP